jgi:hypothetical protein
MRGLYVKLFRISALHSHGGYSNSNKMFPVDNIAEFAFEYVYLDGWLDQRVI